MAALPHRPPARGPQLGSGPPPSLPPRSGGRAARPPPVQPVNSDSEPDDYVEPDGKLDAPEVIYDDFDESGDMPDEPDDVYDDCEDKAPPLPPMPYNQTEEVYDDFEEQRQQQPARLPVRPCRMPPPPTQPLLVNPQEVYDDVENMEAVVVVQQISKARMLPPTPAAPPPVQLPPLPSNIQCDDIYEVDIDKPGMASPPPPPLPPPPPNKSGDQGLRRLPPQPRPIPSPAAPAPAQQSGGFSIDLNQLKNLRAGLRKVSAGGGQESNSGGNTNPKIYNESSPSVSDAKKKFQKAEGPGVLDLKPAITPKFGAPWKSSGAITPNTGVNGTTAPKPLISSHTPTLAPKPTPAPVKQEEIQEGPGVTFLSKAIKDKTFPTTPVAVNKSVTRYEPPPPPVQVDTNFFQDDEIYDDASSGDLMDRYDWYHGKLDRRPAEARVKAVGKDGTYLVRVSEKDPQFPYTLVVLNKGYVNNLRIRLRSDKKFALGDEKADELTFTDVLALINHHKTHNVVLLGGGSQSHIVLQQTPPKN